MKDSPLKDKSKLFALKIIKISDKLKKLNQFELSSQVLRSWTSIWALIRESEYAQSKADLKSKLYIALKEANETVYWLELLEEWNIMRIDDSIIKLLEEIMKMLISSIRTLSKY